MTRTLMRSRRRLNPARRDPGAVWAQGGSPRVVFGFTIASGKITGIEMIADGERISKLEVAFLAR